MPTSPITQAVSSLQALGPRPALSWYSGSGERLELSGDVTLNWLNKTANFLVDSMAEPGARVLVDLPPHWRTVIWGLATLRTGATAVLGSGGTGAFEVVATDRAGADYPGGDLVAMVTLAALARRFPGEVSAGAIDAGPAVMGSADQIIYLPATDPTEVAVTAGNLDVTYAGLGNWLAGAGSAFAAGGRLAVAVPDAAGMADGRGLLGAAALRAAVAAWCAGGSIILIADVPDHGKVDAIVTSERAQLVELPL